MGSAHRFGVVTKIPESWTSHQITRRKDNLLTCTLERTSGGAPARRSSDRQPLSLAASRGVCGRHRCVFNQPTFSWMQVVCTSATRRVCAEPPHLHETQKFVIVAQHIKPHEDSAFALSLSPAAAAAEGAGSHGVRHSGVAGLYYTPSEGSSR